jgi:hypothetical protein
MAHSILQWDERVCFRCGRNGAYDVLDKHHVFGKYNRDKSEAYGLTVYLCHNSCHIFGNDSVHKNKVFDFELKRYAQNEAMSEFGWSEEDFVERFGRSYI